MNNPETSEVLVGLVDPKLLLAPLTHPATSTTLRINFNVTTTKPGELPSAQDVALRNMLTVGQKHL